MALKSWLESANDPATDFPLHSLPYGVFDSGNGNRVGIAIGDKILDLHACATHGLLDGLSDEVASACTSTLLNSLMALGSSSWSTLRRRVTALLDADQVSNHLLHSVEPHLVAMSQAVMRIPATIGDYTDFYASIHHATRVGQLFRPDHPLLSNYKYVPIGYHGRASSIVVSGESVSRPCGQIKPKDGDPVFRATQSLDYELEVGLFIGQGNQLGQEIQIADAEGHIFGLCLVNDWSARDIQSWEYQPLGPFLAKSFATTISPWVVPLEALLPYRVPALERPVGDPAPLPYLASPSSSLGAVDLTLEVYLESEQMRQSSVPPLLLARSNLRNLYWTLAQLLTHHASNGCNLRPGDLLATGTISGPDNGSEGCLLEMQHRPQPIHLPTGEERRFLEDGDRVVFHAYCEKAGLPRLGFGDCSGIIAPADRLKVFSPSAP